MSAYKLKNPLGEGGQANVRVMTKGVQIHFKETGTNYNVDRDNVPKWLKKSYDGVFVRMSALGDRVKTVRPWRGQETVEFTGFYREDQDEDPKPELREATAGRKVEGGKVRKFTIPQHHECSAVLKIVGGEFDGATFSWYMNYDIEREPDDHSAVFCGTKNSLRRIEEFNTAFGLDEKDKLDYSANILPEWEKFLLKRGQVATIIFEEGKPETLVKAAPGVHKTRATKTKAKSRTRSRK